HTWDSALNQGSGGPIVFPSAQAPPLRGSMRTLVMAPEHDLGAVLFDEEVVTFKVLDNGIRSRTPTIPLQASAGAFAKGSTVLVLGGRDGDLRSFDTRGNANEIAKELAVFKGHSGTLRAIACTPDGKRMISGGD